MEFNSARFERVLRLVLLTVATLSAFCASYTYMVRQQPCPKATTAPETELTREPDLLACTSLKTRPIRIGFGIVWVEEDKCHYANFRSPNLCRMAYQQSKDRLQKAWMELEAFEQEARPEAFESKVLYDKTHTRLEESFRMSISAFKAVEINFKVLLERAGLDWDGNPIPSKVSTRAVVVD